MISRAIADRCRRRPGAALMMSLFVMAVSSMLVISILDTQTLQFASLRNTMDYDRARYLAEAGVADALARLEQNFDYRVPIPATQFPPGSGNTYLAIFEDVDGTVLISASGTAGQFTRSLQITVKMGG